MNQDEWHSGLEQQRKRGAERQRQQRAESAEHVVTPGDTALEFMPCSWCKNEDGLCLSCHHNHAVIEALKQEHKVGEEAIQELQRQHQSIAEIRAQAFREAAEWCGEKQNHFEMKVEAEKVWLSQYELGLDCGTIGAYKNSAAHFTALADKESGG